MNSKTHIIQLHGLLHQFVLDRVAGAGVCQAVVLHGVLLLIALGDLQLYLSGHCGSTEWGAVSKRGVDCECEGSGGTISNVERHSDTAVHFYTIQCNETSQVSTPTA